MSAAPKPNSGHPPSAVVVAVGLLAATTLGVQVALTRHFSFLYWHHFAFMIIGIGMLGFGAAGAWLARGGGIETGRKAQRVAARAGLAAALALVGYLLLGPFVDFAPLKLLDSPSQFFTLLALYLLILVPFTALGLAQGSILAGYRAWAHRVYAADLVGAGLGCLLALALLGELSAPASLLAWGAIAALAAGLLTPGGSPGTRWLAWIVAAGLLGLLHQGWAAQLPFEAAPSKQISGGEGPDKFKLPIESTVSSPTIRLDITPSLPFPFLFGGDVDWPADERTRPSRVVFQDGAAPTLLFDIPDPEARPYLGQTSQGLAYQIRREPKVCVIGAGGGADVLIALHHGAASVTAVELNPQMLALGSEHHADFIHGLYQDPRVVPLVAEGRHFLGRTSQRFDVIQMSGVDTFSALASGAYAMSESYIYTVEAGLAVLRALEPDGLFTKSRFYLNPPRETLRLVNVLLQALRIEGAEDPAAHLFVMHADDWATTLLSRRPFTDPELRTLRDWTAQRGWSVVLDPDGSGAEPFVKLVHATPAERTTYLAAYPYNVAPVTDDDPFFFQFYRWRNLLRPPPSEGGYAITRIPVGYAVLAASLIQMILLSALCIFGPLWSQRSRLRGRPGMAGRLIFFGAVGVGFMTVEIISIQVFTVFLGHPIYSMAVTLASLLVSTGLGSAWAGRRTAPPRTIVGSALLAVTVWVGSTALVLQPLQELALGWPLAARAFLVAGWLLPVGLALGMPFPTAIRALEQEVPALVPWAWGTNACFSVIASLLSVLVAMQIGFRSTLVLAAALYWVGYLSWLRTLTAREAGAAPSPRVPALDTPTQSSPGA